MALYDQQIKSVEALHFVRQVERFFGVATLRSLSRTRDDRNILGGAVINPFYPQGTPARRHKITDRHARKAAAWMRAHLAVALGCTVLTLPSDLFIDEAAGIRQ